MTAAVAVVTDSAACLPADLAASYGITVVPLSVVIGTERHDAGAVSRGHAVPRAQAAPRGQGETGQGGQAAVSTASPPPQRFAEAYSAAAAAASAIVSVHLSGSLSGTVNSASLAAAGATVPVRVVDSRSIGMGLGYAVLSAAEAARAGASADEAAAAAAQRAARVRVFFTVESAGHLVAGGRLGADGAATVPPLSARPVLQLRDGRVSLLDKVRTRSAAAHRLAGLAAAAAAGEPADLAVHYLGQAGPAAALAGQLSELVPGVRQVLVVRGDAAIEAHAGPGMLGVVIAPLH